MAPPLIGVTTFYTVKPPNPFRYISVTETYVQALVQAGALPVLIPLGLPETALRSLLMRLDGILFTGGGDLHPGLYGAETHPRLENVDLERDRVELGVARSAIQARLPILGICRGLQTLNVALGGSLYLDIQEQVPGSLKHDRFEDSPRETLVHPVQIAEDSLLGDILGRPLLQVNSGHHQAVRELGSGLAATAFAPDGIVEAFELSQYPFGLAVQWHPEWLTHLEEMAAIFQAFVAASENSRGSKAAGH